MLVSLQLADGAVAGVNNLELMALENIGLSTFHGQHLVTASRQTLASLADETRLSIRARAAYKSVLSRAAEIHAIEREISSKVEVSATLLEPALDGGIWRVPLRSFALAFVLTHPIVLAENLTDAKLYQELGRWYGWHSRLRTLAFFAVPTGGGGSTTSQELRTRVEDHPQFTLCVVDSDRTYPGGPVGDTAAHCREVLPSDLWFARLIVLDVRELENLLPHTWIARTQTGSQSPELCHRLRMLQGAGLSVLTLHTDLKSGFDSCSATQSVTGDLRIQVWEDLQKLPNKSAELTACVQARECLHATACFRLPGLGTTILSQTRDWLASASSEHTREVLANPRLVELARSVFEWGLAAHKLRL